MPVMTEVKRPVVWNPREDRMIHVVWLGLFWFGILAGFGLNMPKFLQRSWPAIVYVHATVYVIWLLLVTVQVLLVVKDKVALHRRLGKLVAAYAVLLLLVGLPTPLTVYATGFGNSQFLAVNLVDVGGFAVMFAWAIAMRRKPAVHKRLIFLSMVAIADPGFSRLRGGLIRLHYLNIADLARILHWHPSTWPPFFWLVFYGNVLLLAVLLTWDLLRYRRLLWQFAVGAGALLASEVWASYMYFDPSWKAFALQVVADWARLIH